MSFFENTRKPVGLGGKFMVAMMNLGHSPVARWGLRFLRLAPNAKVLDCGCGTEVRASSTGYFASILHMTLGMTVTAAVLAAIVTVFIH